MAIAQTGAIYKALTFDGASSRTYGVYITGEAVYNAPEREVEMISIPGRNGAFAMDHGRFENITVTYPAGIFADNETDFADAISDFRNLLCSKKGYCRLTDEYNPNEYRLAVYKSGLEVDPALLRAGQFNIVFECKPQRFLTSGETAVAVASGDTVTNPTLFESKPLLELTGYGDINVNGYTINVADDLVGDVKIAGVVQSYGKTNYYVNFPEIYINNGDDIDVGSVQDVGLSAAITDANGYNITSASIQNASGYSQLLPSIVDDGSPTAILTVALTPTMTFHYGTPLTNKETLDLTLTNSNSDTQTYHIEFGVEYDGNKTIRFYNVGLPNDGYFKCEATDPYMAFNGIVIHSTATTFGSPTYIDCEFGEAYTVINGVYNSLNAYVALGSELPSLAPGSNSITFDNTFTNVKVMPRWWKV